MTKKVERCLLTGLAFSMTVVAGYYVIRDFGYELTSTAIIVALCALIIRDKVND